MEIIHNSLRYPEMASEVFVDLFRESVEVTNDIIWIRPADTLQLIYISPSYERITGRSVEDAYKNPSTILDSVTESDRKAVWNTFAEFTTNNTTLQFAYKDQNGYISWGKSRVYTVFDNAGKPVRRIGVITDITDEVQEQIHLQKNLSRQQEISSKKSTFVSTASHELRTPISSIYSGLELIELLSEKISDKLLSQKIVFFARQTCQEIKRLNTLISDISILEKYNSGRISPHFTDFELVTFCKNVINRIQGGNVSNQQIQFTSAIHEQIVNLDSTLLDLCLTNLLSNALKYSAQTKMAVQVILSKTEDGIQLIVKDYGIGILAEELAKVGTYFFRASNSTGVTGSGLGLVFVRLSINLLGGNLEISSELTKGTICTLTFPTRLC